jgi:hypothetical protein
VVTFHQITLIYNRQDLLKTLDRLGKLEITREELLDTANSEVHTTTPTASPAKPVKPTKKAKKNTGKKDDRVAKIAAGKERAKKLFQEKPYVESEKEEASVLKLQKELQALKQQISAPLSSSK